MTIFVVTLLVVIVIMIVIVVHVMVVIVHHIGSIGHTFAVAAGAEQTE